MQSQAETRTLCVMTLVWGYRATPLHYGPSVFCLLFETSAYKAFIPDYTGVRQPADRIMASPPPCASVNTCLKDYLHMAVVDRIVTLKVSLLFEFALMNQMSVY